MRGRGKETYATILVDLTPVIDGTGPSRLVDVRPGRSKKVLATWLKERTQAFRENIEVVTMGACQVGCVSGGGFSGCSSG